MNYKLLIYLLNLYNSFKLPDLINFNNETSNYSPGLLFNSKTNLKHESVCYITNWSIYREPVKIFNPKFSPSWVNPQLCTNVVYFALSIDDNFNIVFNDEWSDIGLGQIREAVNLKNTGNVKTVSFSLGGWNDSLKNRYVWLQLLKPDNDAVITKFSKNILNFMERYGFNGVDFDYEYPVCLHNNCDYKFEHESENYINMLNKVNKILKKKNSEYKVSVVITANNDIIDVGFKHLSNLSQDVKIHIASYDYYGDNNTIGHNAPKSSKNLKKMSSVESTILKLLPLVKSSKSLIVGVPSYGRGYKLDVPIKKYDGKPMFGRLAIGKSNSFPYSKEEGFISFFEICVERRLKPYVSFYAEDEGSFISLLDSNNLIAYDDIEDMKIIRYLIKKYDLGGSMMFSIDNDDFNGFHCNKGNYPLLRALVDTK